MGHGKPSMAAPCEASVGSQIPWPNVCWHEGRSAFGPALGTPWAVLRSLSVFAIWMVRSTRPGSGLLLAQSHALGRTVAHVSLVEGQRHYSGTYWSAPTQSHVLHESRLELARLLFANFESSVHGSVAQPFLLKAMVDGRVRRHVPDYVLSTERGPVVVDVKPRCRLSAPEVASTLVPRAPQRRLRRGRSG